MSERSYFMSPYAKWLLTSLITFLILFTSIFGYQIYTSYTVDPLWNFTHDNEYNTIQVGFDERQQKTNYITNRPMKNYDDLLIGTSRVTYMNQSGFENSKVYNYGLSALTIQDYNDYISYAEDQKGEDFDQIYMELYFNSFAPPAEDSTYVKPEEAFDTANAFFYKYKSLFSYDTYKKASENKDYSLGEFHEGYRTYNRANEVSTTYVNPKINDLFRLSIPDPDTIYSTKEIPYNDQYKAILETIRDEHTDSKIIPFTDPMSAVRLKEYLANPNQLEAYERWFEEMVEVYGQVYSFHSVNEYTIDPTYWFDELHFYPNLGDIFVAHLDGSMKNEEILTIVTSENIDTYLTDLKNEVQAFQPKY